MDDIEGSIADSVWGIFDLVEGFALANVIDALQTTGILDELTQWRTIKDLAHTADLNPEILSVVLEYACTRTDIVEKNQEDRRYRLTPRYENRVWLTYLLDQYLGAYRQNMNDLPSILRDPGLGVALKNEERHAAAFRRVELSGFPELVHIIAQIGFTGILDIGCGNAGLLTSLARVNPAFRGWGMDANPHMCAEATARVEDLGLSDRIMIVHGDVRSGPPAVAEEDEANIQAVTASSLLNEFFGSGIDRAVEWVSAVRTKFPGRVLLVADYYGSLGNADFLPSRHGCLHDFVQCLSGQGIPPDTAKDWEEIYERSGCDLIQSIELPGEIRRFIHLVSLEG